MNLDLYGFHDVAFVHSYMHLTFKNKFHYSVDFAFKKNQLNKVMYIPLLNLVHGCFVAHVHESGELNSNQQDVLITSDYMYTQINPQLEVDYYSGQVKTMNLQHWLNGRYLDVLMTVVEP